MLRDICEYDEGVVIIWDDSAPIDNVYEFTSDEYKLLKGFVDICPYPCIVDESSMFCLFGDYLNEDCKDTIKGGGVLLVDGFYDERLTSLYSASVALRYGVHAIVTDKGSLAYLDYSGYKKDKLRLSEFCSHVMSSSLWHKGSNAILIFDNSLTVCEGFCCINSFFSSDKVLVDLNEVTDPDKLQMYAGYRQWLADYDIIHDNPIFSNSFTSSYVLDVKAGVIPKVPDESLDLYRTMYRPNGFHIPLERTNRRAVLVWYALAKGYKVKHLGEVMDADVMIANYGKYRSGTGLEWELNWRAKSDLLYMVRIRDEDIMREFAEYAEDWIDKLFEAKIRVVNNVVVGIERY